MASGCLIVIDWGTTSFRAALVGYDGTIMARIATGDGLTSVEAGKFEAVLDRVITPFETGGRLPIIASGMVTSRTGWLETPYLPCPAGLGALAQALSRLETPGGRTIHFVTGVMWKGLDGSTDVMRGEETQVMGLHPAGDAMIVLPGTHSKWVQWGGGRIESFRTMMTGDVFAAVRDHTIMRLMPSGPEASAAAFEDGVQAGLADEGSGLLGKVFRLRASVLTGNHAPGDVHERLSGLLIGSEIAEARRFLEIGTAPLVLIGTPDLCARYARACAVAGIHTTTGDPDAAPAGLFRIARAAGLV